MIYKLKQVNGLIREVTKEQLDTIIQRLETNVANLEQRLPKVKERIEYLKELRSRDDV